MILFRAMEFVAEGHKSKKRLKKPRGKVSSGA